MFSVVAKEYWNPDCLGAALVGARINLTLFRYTKLAKCREECTRDL